MSINLIENVLKDIKLGKFVIVVDDEDRENEGDLVMASQLITPEAVNFMVKEKTPLLRMKMKHNGILLPDKTIRLENLNPNQEVRLVYKIPILMDSVNLILSSPQTTKIRDLSVIKHQDQVVNLAKKIMSGKRHQGGVTFDCLPPSQ